MLLGGGIVGLIAILYFANRKKKDGGIITGGVKPPKEESPKEPVKPTRKPKLEGGTGGVSPVLQEPVVKQPITRDPITRDPIKVPPRTGGYKNPNEGGVGSVTKEPVKGSVRDVSNPTYQKPSITPITRDNIRRTGRDDFDFALFNGDMNTLDVH